MMHPMHVFANFRIVIINGIEGVVVKSASLECERSWVRVKQNTIRLVFVTAPLSVGSES